MRHFEFTSPFAQIEICHLWYKAEKIIFGSLFQAFTCHEYVLVVFKKKTESLSIKRTLMSLMCPGYSYFSMHVLYSFSQIYHIITCIPPNSRLL